MRMAPRRMCRLMIFVDENDQWGHKPLVHEIVRRAKDAGLAGASAFRGIEGFGAQQRIHTSRILSLSLDLPIAVVIIDAEESIRAFLPQLDEIVDEGLVTLDAVEAIPYASGRPSGRSRR